MLSVYLSILIFTLLFAFVIVEVKRAYATTGVLSNTTAFAVWLLYLLHGVTTAYAAWRAYWPLPLSPLVSHTIGWGFLILGTTFVLAGVFSFRSIRRMSGLDTNILITAGVYRYSRNPQNAGWGLVLPGLALLGNSGLALVLTAMFWLMFRLYVPLEEKYLEQVFGPAYREFCSETPRFLGRPAQRK